VKKRVPAQVQAIQHTPQKRQGLLKKLSKESRKPPEGKEAFAAFQKKRKIN
jgi:hypothetical protein